MPPQKENLDTSSELVWKELFKDSKKKQHSIS